MKLRDYIHFNYIGSQTKFADAQGMSKQDVWRKLQSGNWYVYDAMLLQCKREIL